MMAAITMTRTARTPLARELQAFARAFTRPLEEWTSAHLCCVAAAAALISFECGWSALRVARDARLHASRTALVALQARLAETTASVRALPMLTQRVATWRPDVVEPSVTEQFHRLGDTAMHAGLSLDVLEPVSLDGKRKLFAGVSLGRASFPTQRREGAGPKRPSGEIAAAAFDDGVPADGGTPDNAFRIKASGDFFGALRFFNALHRLPMLVTPDEVRITSSGPRILLDTLLTTHARAGGAPGDERQAEHGAASLPRTDAPPARPSSPSWPSPPPLPPNPFAAHRPTHGYTATHEAPVLIGVMRDGARRAALLALGDATALVRAGGRIESSLVGRIGPDFVTLAERDGCSRVIRFPGTAK